MSCAYDFDWAIPGILFQAISLKWLLGALASARIHCLPPKSFSTNQGVLGVCQFEGRVNEGKVDGRDRGDDQVTIRGKRPQEYATGRAPDSRVNAVGPLGRCPGSGR
jgi:hypothetical protein